MQKGVSAGTEPRGSVLWTSDRTGSDSQQEHTYICMYFTWVHSCEITLQETSNSSMLFIFRSFISVSFASDMYCRVAKYTCPVPVELKTSH